MNNSYCEKSYLLYNGYRYAKECELYKFTIPFGEMKEMLRCIERASPFKREL
jgi:hypothetical protein